MTTCTVLHLAELAIDAPLRRLIRDELTKPDSDFHKSVETKTDGHIAVVWADEVAVGWSRTEQWIESTGLVYDTLEAFVRPERRLQGIAAFAAAGLYTACLHDNGCTVAVFSPHMMLVAKRAGFFPVLFERDANGWWRRA
jgi:hypothetical protein